MIAVVHAGEEPENPEHPENLFQPVIGASGKSDAFPAWGRGTAERWIGRLP